MTALSIALRAIWWRLGSSVAIAAIAVFATGFAAAGPLYLQAAGESVLRSALTTASPTATGTGAEVSLDATGAADPDIVKSQLEKAMTGALLRSAYPDHVLSIERTTFQLDPKGRRVGRGTLVWRQDACAHLVVVAGRCPGAQAGTEVMVSVPDAARNRWKPGNKITMAQVADPAGPTDHGDRSLTIVGVYRPIDPTGAYWFNDTREYFGGTDRLQEQRTKSEIPTLEALLVGRTTLDRLTASTAFPVLLVDDLPLDVRSVSVGNVDELRRQLDATGTRLYQGTLNQRGYSGALVTRVRSALTAAASGRAGLRLPLLVVVLELMLLGWFVLFLVTAGAAEARAGEVALAKVRGSPTVATFAFGMLETLILLVVATPLGVASAWLGLRAGHQSVFGAGPPPVLTTAAGAAGLAAAAGAVVAAAAAGLATLRRPVLQQWRGASRRPPARSLAAPAVVVAVCAAALVQLWFGGPLDAGHPDVLALLGPTLLALAGAMIGARLLPVLARASFRPTRGSRWIGLFIGGRELARRPGGSRLVIMLTTAVAMVTFSVLGSSVFLANRDDRAATEIGAARVVLVDPYGGPDLRQVVRRLDPSGRQAMAVADVVSSVTGATTADTDAAVEPSAEPLRLLAVDVDRLPIAFWREDFADVPLAALAERLAAAPARPPTFQGHALRLDLTVAISCCGPVSGEVAFVSPDGHAITVDLGRLSPSRRRYLVATPACVQAACQLEQVAVRRAGAGAASLIGRLDLNGVEALGDGAAHPVAGALDPARWSGLSSSPPSDAAASSDASTQQVERRGSGPALRFAVGPQVLRAGLQARAPSPLPVVVTSPYNPGPDARAMLLTVPTAVPLTVQVQAVANVVPRAGRYGALVSLDLLQAARPIRDIGMPVNEVWLSEQAPADFPARLRAAGVSVTSVQSAALRAQTLARQGPALAVLLLRSGATAAALLAVAAVLVTLMLSSRRRAFELAALRAIGFAPRSLLAAGLVEQLLLVAYSTALGVGLGILGARTALPTLPEFADRPAVPQLLIPIHPQAVLLIVAALAGVLGPGVLAGCALLVRAAEPARLREGQG